MTIRGTIVMHKYEIGRLLGQGNFAKVYHARDINNGQSVAIKVIDKEKIMKVGLMEQIKREISVMRLVRHPNIVHLFEVMASRTKIYVVMEYVRGGDLFGKIEKGRISEDDARKYFQQLVSAIDYCHSRGVYHRDLKPENILLDENDNVKVTDFGLSALVDSRRQDILLRTTCGTPAYVAPEVIHCIGYDGAKADIWSSGVILFVLMAGQYPFHDSNLMELYRKIGRGEFKCPNWFSSRARKLISKILDPDPSTRISIPQVRETTWFKKGLEDKQMRIEEQSKDIVPLNVAVFNNTESNAADEKQDIIQIMNLNAFDIISLSAGFDLSGLFEDNNLRKEAWFISTKSSAIIISKLQGMAQCLKLKVNKKDGGILKMQALQEGRNGCLAIDFEIFEGSSSFYLVGVKLSSGDTSEYHKLFEEGIKPTLSDIVWSWQSHMQYEP